MTHREQVIVELLERYTELADPMQSGNGGEGGWGLSMPGTYTASVRELERLLGQMREERRSQWWHVTERYIRAERSKKTLTLKGGRWYGLEPHEAVVGVPGGWTLALATERSKKTRKGDDLQVTIARWNSAVRAHKVTLGVAWIADQWDARRIGEPMLPAAVMAAA